MSNTIRRKTNRIYRRSDYGVYLLLRDNYGDYAVYHDSEEGAWQLRRYYTDNIRTRWPGRTFGKRLLNRQLRSRGNSTLRNFLKRNELDVVMPHRKRQAYAWWYN